jgi:hypothetical protein
VKLGHLKVCPRSKALKVTCILYIQSNSAKEIISTYAQQIFCEPIARMKKAAIFELVSFYPNSRSPTRIYIFRLRCVFRHNALLTLFASCFPSQCTVDIICVIFFPHEINWWRGVSFSGLYI